MPVRLVIPATVKEKRMKKFLKRCWPIVVLGIASAYIFGVDFWGWICRIGFVVGGSVCYLIVCFIFSKQKTIKAIDECIEHHERMRHWAAFRSAEELVSRMAMKCNLGENWTGSYCILCKLAGTNPVDSTAKCENCVLTEMGLSCDSPIKEELSPWQALRNSRTWGDFAEAETHHMIPALYKAKEYVRKKRII